MIQVLHVPDRAMTAQTIDLPAFAMLGVDRLNDILMAFAARLLRDFAIAPLDRNRLVKTARRRPSDRHSLLRI